MSVNYYKADDEIIQRLTFFVLPEDNDGPEDFESLTLYNDAEGLYWKLTADDWVVYNDADKTWIGNYDIAFPPGENISGGAWRVVIKDKSGAESENTFGFDLVPERYPFPTFTVNIAEKTYQIESDYPVSKLLCYDRNGVYTRSFVVAEKNGTIDSLGLPSDVRSVALWAEDAEYFVSALTDIHPVR
jgi:hypothetical protein